ncbi:MAG: glycoside hydrolase family 3 N-terminal domain-containing protein [Lacibacter sp.]
MKLFLLLTGFFALSFYMKAEPLTGAVNKTRHLQYQEPDSLDIKIGQLIIFGFYGTGINKNDLVYKAVQEGKVGSILLYARNVSLVNTAARLKEMISEFQMAAPIPLFISIDQEGGKVNRLKPELGFPFMPSAQWLGTMNNTDSTKFYADTLAFTIAQLGINLNYAPVLDIYNPKCPVLGARERCFSADPNVITTQAITFINSHHSFGVKTVVKHFPGHGNSLADTHLGVADVTKTWQPAELSPYKNIFETGNADAVMTAHIVNGQLDPSLLPATLSKKIITGLLRDSLHFSGVIFSDDMQMKAISEQYSLEQSVFLALDAGVDVLMFSNNIPGVKDYEPANIHAIIKKLVLNGKISSEQIDASFKRVMALKSKTF